MSDKKTGGPAFPSQRWEVSEYAGSAPCPWDHASGMTLRDYFAAKVIAVCIAEMPKLEEAAALAYQIADAMIEAREA